MAKVLGIGGVFFKSLNADALLDWYEKYIGLPRTEQSSVTFFTRHYPLIAFRCSALGNL